MTEETARFDQLGLAPALLDTLNNLGYETPTPIQLQAIPAVLQGRNVLGLAQTGTGKTAAFALPLLSIMETGNQGPQTLVLCPTRELAIQVSEAFQAYAKGLDNFHVLPIYGGADMRNQLRGLKQNPQVIVGTPGRVMDHLRRNSLDLSGLKHLVLDEADEMLRMGFVEDIDWILEHTPATKQVALFSATMLPQVKRLTQQYLNDPVRIEIKPNETTLGQIEQFVWHVGGINKLEALTRILEVEDWNAAILFVRTKVESQFLAEKLAARGHACTALSGDVAQKQREDIINQFKKGKLDLVIATDVAARGLDVERISHVINWDIPGDVQTYIHRIGRTGRAGRSGKAIMFVKPRERRLLRDIERVTKQQLKPYPLPSAAELSEHRAAAFKTEIEERIETADLGFFRAVIDGWTENEDLDLRDIAAALAMMAQEDKPLQVPEDPKPRPAKERRERPDRDGKPRRERGAPRDRALDYDANKYRLDVGRKDGVQPGNIVGAIANEAGIEGRFINNISIFDNYTLVDLPTGMPKEIFEQLRKTRVKGRPLNLRAWVEDGKGEKRPPRKNKPPRKS
ncbi:DEAD/DEAH box helicase [Saccharospirillum salsuginis]|uniref:ATP-dependent RNA helicase DeaD n=1 Tax=Saccharospirillum salsuginis TaxID=418750 RepID=A0A918K2I9_9GAMM|nr:DEAD/DEAH box helicase [Saccharospirillum salsuginis]GGX43948.1 ATP-dependent RNA helicase DeaD [Saccharospirillum salsuginis]